MTLAELYEEQGNLQRAIDEYQKAADMFSAEVRTISCMFKNIYLVLYMGIIVIENIIYRDIFYLFKRAS